MSIDSSFESSLEKKESFAVESEKSPETLEREIDAQRSSIGNIVDALESKFSPGQLVDQALAYAKGNGGEFFGNLGNTIKANPVPTVLTSVGLLWLMLGQNRSPAPSSAATGSGASSLGHLGERLSDMAHNVTDSLGNARSRIEETAHRMHDKTSDVTDKAAHLTGSVSVSDTLSSAGERLNRSSHDASDALLEQARKAQSSFNYLLREQPLALAAIGIALGAAIGAALPSTQREDQLMGQASDQLTDKAKQVATEGYDKVKEMGADLAGEAKSVASSASSPNTGNMEFSSPSNTAPNAGTGLG
ncbi:DUF3618 domain-containing protein [Pseudomonas sp. DSP3-2-2]|uniref:DUF3618 domain-containing protein n=1 Tax=unclassified Pseudomonas TaxID=196821 RepID=UPI003CE9A21E